MSSTVNKEVVQGAIAKLVGTDLTYEERDALLLVDWPEVDRVVADSETGDVEGFGASGAINWGPVGKVVSNLDPIPTIIGSISSGDMGSARIQISGTDLGSGRITGSGPISGGDLGSGR